MDMTESTAEESGLHLNHTLTGLLWIGLIYVLSWKPEVLSHFLAGSEALAGTILKALGNVPIF